MKGGIKMILEFIKEFCKLIKTRMSLIYILEIAFYISIYDNHDNEKIVSFIISKFFNSKEFLLFVNLFLTNIIIILITIQIIFNCAFIITEKYILKTCTDRWFIINAYFISAKFFTYILINYQQNFNIFSEKIFLSFLLFIVIYLTLLLISLYCNKLLRLKAK